MSYIKTYNQYVADTIIKESADWDAMEKEIKEYAAQFAKKNKKVVKEIKAIVKKHGGATERADVMPRVGDFVDEVYNKLAGY